MGQKGLFGMKKNNQTDILEKYLNLDLKNLQEKETQNFLIPPCIKFHCQKFLYT